MAAAVETTLSAEELFDSVGPAYEAAFEGCEPQAASIEWVKSQLTGKRAKCVDIGCGTGRPVCSELAKAGHDVLGIDISSAMLEAARKNVPDAKFEKMDVKEFNPGPASFDVITVYFSLIAGVTQDEIRGYIKSIYDWLKPGGLFVFATVPVPGNNDKIQWMGRPLVYSCLDATENVNRIREVGFEVVQNQESTFTPKAVEAGLCKAEEVWEEPHLFVYARKPQ